MTSSMALPSAGGPHAAPHAAAAVDGQPQAAAAQEGEPALPMRAAGSRRMLLQQQEQQQPVTNSTLEAAAPLGNATAPAPLPSDTAGLAALPWHLTKTSSDMALAQPQGVNASKKVVVLVVDSGADLSHEMLLGRIAKTYNALDKNEDVKDRMGHGTKVAVITAQADPYAVLLVCKNLDERRQGREFVRLGSTQHTMDCLLWGAENGATIVVFSQITRTNTGNLRYTIQELERRGIMVVGGAGNDGDDLAKASVYPPAWAPSLPNFIAVAGTTSEDVLSRDSNYGSAALLAAPGEDILEDFSGTSAAAPQVAAAMSLVQRVCNAGYPIDALLWIEMLMSSVDRVEALRGKVRSSGRLNTAALLGECLRRVVVEERPSMCLQSAPPCTQRCGPSLRCSWVEGQE